MVRVIRRRFDNREALYWLILIAILVGFFVWGVNHLGGFAWGWDEGVLLMTGRLTARGYRLYAEIWHNYPPLWPLLLATVFRGLGESVVIGRCLALVFSLVGLASVAWAAYEVSRSRVSALAATILLLLSPPFLPASRTAMPDMPSASMAALAMAMALCYLQGGGQGWLAGAGLGMALSLLLKPLAASSLGPVLLAISLLCSPQERSNFRARIKPLLLVALAGGSAVLACALLVDMRAFLQQMVGTYWASRGVYSLDLGRNLRKIWGYLTWSQDGAPRYGFIALSAFGLLSLLRRCAQPTAWAVLAWLGLTLGILATHAPLYNHLLIVLLFPLVIAGGNGLAYLAEWPRRLHPRRGQQWFFIIGLLAVVLYATDLPHIFALDIASTFPPEDDEDRDAREAIRLIKALTAPGDFIVTDSPMIAFRAGRMVPPPLCNTSSMRIETGDLTAEKLIATTENHAPQAVIFWEDRLEMLPAYVDWVKDHYRLARWYGKERRIYIPLEPIEYAHRTNLGDSVLLLGYNIDRLALKPGEMIHLTLYWQARKGMATNYTVFVHLLDRECHKWGQADGIPARGVLPTTCWQPGDIIADKHEIVVPPETCSGEYLLGVGMYNRKTGNRLPVFGPNGERVL